MNTNEDYNDWEGDIFDAIEEQIEITRSDAQGIVMAQEFYMAQCWAKGMTAEQTAKFIIEKSLVK